MTAAMRNFSQLATAEATFESLENSFKYDPAITKALLENEGVQTLNDFRYIFHSEAEILGWVSQHVEQNQRFQGSRLKQAWMAVRAQGEARDQDQDRSKVSMADLDDPLDDEEIHGMKDKFWKRHHITFPPEVMPADSLISRVFREMAKRCLMIFNIALVKNLLHQVTTSRKRRKVADDLYVDEPDDAPEPAHDVQSYLAKLFTYLVALAMAGVDRMENAPEART